MGSTMSIAYGNIQRLLTWLDGVYSLQGGTLQTAVLDMVCNNIGQVLPKMPGFSNTEAKWSRKDTGILIACKSPVTLPKYVQYLRKERLLSALRFAQWAFVVGETTDDEKRCLLLSNQADPPNDVSLADNDFAVHLNIPGRTYGRTGLPAPPHSIWLTLDEIPESASVLVRPTSDGHAPVRAYADMWGTENLADAIQGSLLKKQGSPSSLTVLCRAIFAEVSKKAKELGVRCDILKAGPGADACHIVTDSADRLLRLTVWVQSCLAAKGLAFLPWTLGVGSPEYVDDQPSDTEFRKLHRLLKETSNGDIIATADFVARLKRRELRMLVGLPIRDMTQEPIVEAVEIRWWEYPFRSTSR